jgi:hypothetical protein
MAKSWARSQIHNFPNHADLGVPEGNLASGNYGRITSLNGSTTAQIVVVGARFIFLAEVFRARLRLLL